MSEAQPVDIKTEVINAAPHLRNQARIEADEAELEALKKRIRGETDETEEEAVEAESDSEEPEAAPIQANACRKGGNDPFRGSQRIS